MKFSIKYFILVLSMVYTVMSNCQYGTVSTTSSCPDEGTGSATVSLFVDLFESDWHNPPFSAEIVNLDTGEEWDGVIGTQQGNVLSGKFDNLTDGDYEVTINVSPRCFLTLEFKIETILEFDVVSFVAWQPCVNETRLIWDVNNSGNYLLTLFGFKWTNGSTNNSFTLTTPSHYAVTITHKSSGCEHVEEYEFLDYDFKFEGVISNANCTLGASIEVFTTADEPYAPFTDTVDDKQARNALSIGNVLSNSNLTITSSSFRFIQIFTKGINLEIDSPQKDLVNIVVINAVGSVMFKSKVDVEAGQNIKYLNEFEELPSGFYTVKLKSDLMDHTTRVIRIE